MKVAIDARYVVTSDDEVSPKGGIGRYTYNLVRQLANLDPDLELRLIVPRSNRRPVLDAPACRVDEVKWADEPHSLRTQLLLAPSIDLRDSGLFHSPFNMLPIGLPCPSVVTIHDVMWVTEPRLCARFLPERVFVGARYLLSIGHALSHADHVLTISHASRVAIEHYRPETRGRITVTHHGTEPIFHVVPEAEARQALAPLLDPSTGFVLMVGQGSPYKNHARAIRAFFRAFPDRADLKLVLVRRFRRIDREVARLLAQREARARVVVLPSVTEAQLRALYNLARIFFFPSLAEGFGMPLLEAMACGTPVLTSSSSVMPEVVGDAALMVDPLNVDALARGLQELDGNEALRRDLVERGTRRTELFTWERCARETLEVYRNLLARAGTGSPRR